MRNSFHDELRKLQDDLLKMGSLVEEAISLAVNSLAKQDSELAQRVIDGDDRIDEYELEIERNCLRLLALQQPLAKDFRIIGTALKIITDLERMADHAVDIAEITLSMADQPLIKPLVDIPRMAQIAKEMTRDSLNAYVNQDKDLAYAMIKRDDEVDHLYNQIFRELLLIMMEDPKKINQATLLSIVGLHLERIADHATNLGEWVIYMVTGVRENLNK
jgi:phosphate transport system protein